MAEEIESCRVHESGWLERSDWEVEQAAIRAAYSEAKCALAYDAVVMYYNGGSVTQPLKTELRSEAQAAADCLADKYREAYGTPYMAVAELRDIRKLRGGN